MSLAVKGARMATQGAGRVRPGVGDPGLFGFLGGVAKRAIGAVGRATGLLPQQPQVMQIAAPPPQVRPGLPLPGPFRARPEAILPGGRPFIERESAAGMKLACPSGFHPNKSDYFLKDGTFVAKGTRCVKNRSRNPLNPRALRRAVSRIDAGKVWQEKMRGIETDKFTKAGKRKC